MSIVLAFVGRLLVVLVSHLARFGVLVVAGAWWLVILLIVCRCLSVVAGAHGAWWPWLLLFYNVHQK